VNVSLFVLWGDSLTYTVAKALATNGHEVQIWVADWERHGQAVWGVPERIAAIPGVSVDSARDRPSFGRIDRLVVQGSPHLLDHKKELDALARSASRITAISSGDRSRPYRRALSLQWRERQWYGRWFRKVTQIAYKDGFYRFDLLGITRPRFVVGFDAHSRFLHDQTLFDAIHAEDWESGTPRIVGANFVGSRDPQRRRAILATIEALFAPSFAVGDKRKRWLWHAYSDDQPAALSQSEFLKVLSDSDFTLCPPGY
jgi:hypothetical protein